MYNETKAEKNRIQICILKWLCTALMNHLSLIRLMHK